MIDLLLATWMFAAVAPPAEVSQAASTTVRAAPRLVVAGAMVVSMRDGESDRPRTVIVQGDRITAIIDPAMYRFELGDALIRADGLWLLPGLNVERVDASDAVTLRRLALRGVTGVGLADPTALAALAPLEARPEARLPTLRRSPHRAAIGKVDAPPSTDVAAHARGDVALPGDVVPRLCGEVASGASPIDVLRSVTRDAALALGRVDAGEITAGNVADLVLLEADPRRDIAALGSIRAVILRGRLVTRSEIESTEDLITELADSAERPFEGVADAPDWGEMAWHRTFLVRFDGLPRGATRAQVRTLIDGAESHVQSVLWSPLHSATTTFARHDRLGRVVFARVRHDSAVDALETLFERVDDRWRITTCADTGDLSVIDEGGIGRDPPDTIVLDLLPTPPDLRRLALDRAGFTTIGAAEFVYGPGPTLWSPIALATSGAHAPPGRDAVERAVATHVPAGGAVATLWTCALTRRVPILATGDARRNALLASRVTVGFDASGWPIAAIIAVPDGLWEVHPWDARELVPEGPLRGNDAGSP